MQLECPNCRAEIRATDINLDRMVAKCGMCNAVFSFVDQVDGVRPSAALERMSVPLPKGMEVSHEGMDLLITWRWFSPKYLATVFFVLLWDGFLVFWYIIAISAQIWVMALFATGHLAVGVGITYWTLAGFLNRTTVRVSPALLAVHHAPLPWPGSKQLTSTMLRQLYCKERAVRGRRSTSYTYEVRALTNDGTDEAIVTGLDDSEQALYLEQEIERFLGIQDVPVPGALAR